MRILKKSSNEYTNVYAIDEPGPGGANHSYVILNMADLQFGDIELAKINFQKDLIKKVGVNGIQNEDLIAVVIDRLEGFQDGELACEQNGRTLEYLYSVLKEMQDRTADRIKRGVEGTNQK